MIKRKSYFVFIVGALFIISLIEVLTGRISLYGVLGYSALFVFLSLTYWLEKKWLVGRYWQLGIYTAYWFLVGTLGSLVLARNPASFQLLFLYFGLSFIGSLIWCVILPWVFSEKINR